MDFKTNIDPTTGEDKPLAVVFSGSFEDTPDVASLTIEEGIEEIAENAFREFEHLTEIYLPKSLKKISACAFS